MSRLAAVAVSALLVLATSAPAAEPVRRPNIVWIVTEDISPNLGCYGDPDAVTPNLDNFASQGARFTRAFSHAPVCAPSRSGLITGMYPTTMGTHHMRSKLVTPPPIFLNDLRKSGYFVAYPGKQDFNFEMPTGWVDTTEDWTKKPDVLPRDKPFFAYVNFLVTHESQARATKQQYEKNTARLTAKQRRDRTKLKLPPYFPDAPEVRECVAKYHENITAMDYLVGDVLKLIDEMKWSENTVVIFFGDHGWGLTRGKRWCYDSGTRVPFLVRWPGKVKPGCVRDDLICLLDLAPTMLSLAGVAKPDRMPGRIILGDKTEPAPKYVFSCRDRMDETYDRVRSARGERFRYVKNFHPELPYAQYINYMDEMPIMKVWRKRAFAGKLDDVQKLFFARTKPAEELYDLEADPYEVKNLAEDPRYVTTLKEMREAVKNWIVETNDLGAEPERDLIKRGLVKDVLASEYDARLKLHPKTPPVP